MIRSVFLDHCRFRRHDEPGYPLPVPFFFASSALTASKRSSSLPLGSSKSEVSMLQAQCRCPLDAAGENRHQIVIDPRVFDGPHVLSPSGPFSSQTPTSRVEPAWRVLPLLCFLPQRRFWFTNRLQPSRALGFGRPYLVKLLPPPLLFSSTRPSDRGKCAISRLTKPRKTHPNTTYGDPFPDVPHASSTRLVPPTLSLSSFQSGFFIQVSTEPPKNPRGAPNFPLTSLSDVADRKPAFTPEI